MVCLGIPHRIIIGKSSHICFTRLCCLLLLLLRLLCYLHAGGSLTRGEDQDRIDFLAQARNRALEPLWLTTAHSASSASVHDDRVAWDFVSATHSAHPIWPAKKVVFLNDVYFCAQDVLR